MQCYIGGKCFATTIKPATRVNIFPDLSLKPLEVVQIVEGGFRQGETTVTGLFLSFGYYLPTDGF